MPCYQVEQNIPVTTEVLFDSEELYPKGLQFEYIFVDDGSTDGTLNALKRIQTQRPQQIKIVKLSRNFGANAAALAGLTKATGDCCSFLAADLQDPPELISQMYSHWQKGYKLVVCNRQGREESWSRVFAASIYHFIMRSIVPSQAPKGGFDLVLFDRQVRDLLVQMSEKNTYLPYLLMWLGFEYVSIPYVRRKREIGQSMWTFSKKIKAAIDSVFGFSYIPVRIISVSGFILGLGALAYLGTIVYNKIVGGAAVEGWSSLMVVVLGVAAFQMIALGILGEYIWRAFDASRSRPSFVIDQVIESVASSSLPK